MELFTNVAHSCKVVASIPSWSSCFYIRPRKRLCDRGR